MNKDKNIQPDKKKRFPSGFLLILLAALLLFFTVQNFSPDKRTPISFSHQLEHVFNLDLIHKDASKKVSLNDHLVSFTGRFKEDLSDEAKAKYRYLEFLDKSHSLAETKNRLAKELQHLQEDVYAAGKWYLEISGQALPQTGYRIIDPYYNTTDRQNSIVITETSNQGLISLPDIEKKIERLSLIPHIQMTEFYQVEREFLALIQNFRAPILGIGSEALKKQLRTLDEQVSQTIGSPSLTGKEKISIYISVLQQLKQIVQFLDQQEEHARLLPLRSVRNYLESLKQYQLISNQLYDIEAKLNRSREDVSQAIWFFNNKELSSRMLEQENPEEFHHWFINAKKEWEAFPGNRGAFFKAPDQPRNQVLEKTFKSEEPSPNYFNYLLTILPVLFVILLLYFVFSRQMKGMGSAAMSFGKSPARMLNRSKNKITFKDVAGVEEAKEELQEIVDFLKNPGKFTALGARIPKGVLCIGPPGTGKTLIAKATAGEASRPFFSISGSDFVEMFVGVGASRIRDLFDQAKKSAPCIVFIDEIDAVGRHRGGGIGGGHDEREQTLNQLLVEMDGFDTNEGVILMAATNRPDVLDKALLRPGRFDRRIVLDLPDIKGRFEILQVHAGRIKLDSGVDLMFLARATPGASGADLMNILNESALLAARRGRLAVTMQDVTESCDKVRYGKERRSLEIDENEKKTTAYHESGHAVIGLLVEHADPVEKVTIIPRGLSLGATYFIPKKNRVSYWKREVLDRLAVLMGGRVAEELFVGDISSGARGDFLQATRLVRQMVCEWGMSEALGTVAYDDNDDLVNYGMGSRQEKSYSQETLQGIDSEVKNILNSAYSRAKSFLEPLANKVHQMAELLMEFETLDKEDIQKILDGSFNIDEKRKKVEEIENLLRKTPPPPPPSEKKQNIPKANPSPNFS